MKGHGMPCPNGLGATGTTATAACSGRFVRNAFTIIETSLPWVSAWVSDSPLVGTPMSRGRAHDRGHLIHRRGLEGDRLAEVAHEEDLAEGGAPLGAVRHRDRPSDAEKRQRRPHGLARLERAYRQRGAAALHLSHGDPPDRRRRRLWQIHDMGGKERSVADHSHKRRARNKLLCV
jgi:hypothetical protein